MKKIIFLILIAVFLIALAAQDKPEPDGCLYVPTPDSHVLRTCGERTDFLR